MFGLRRIAFPLVVAALTLSLHGQSAASIIPPGNSAADQYTEGYPGPTGNEQVDANVAAQPEPSLPAATIKRFRNRGPAGQAALSLATYTDPADEIEQKDEPRIAENDSLSAGETADGNLEVIKQATGISAFGDPGYGLAGILFVVTILAIGYAIRRNRALR